MVVDGMEERELGVVGMKMGMLGLWWGVVRNYVGM